jgi:hypothetical protein
VCGNGNEKRRNCRFLVKILVRIEGKKARKKSEKDERKNVVYDQTISDGFAWVCDDENKRNRRCRDNEKFLSTTISRGKKGKKIK